MEEEHMYDVFSGLEEDFDEFEACVLHKEWPLSDLIPCPECQKVFESGEAVVAHCVEVHSWEERGKNYMKNLMLNDISDPQTMLQGLKEEEEYKSEKSAAKPYNFIEPNIGNLQQIVEPNVKNQQQVVEPNVKNQQQVVEPKVEVSLELTLGRGNGV